MSEPGRYRVLATLDGGHPSGDRTRPDVDRPPAPWESSMQATCECLSWRGTLDNLERRHAEDDLGEKVYAGFPFHARSALVTTHTLLDRGVITQDELEAKMEEVRARLRRV